MLQLHCCNDIAASCGVLNVIRFLHIAQISHQASNLTAAMSIEAIALFVQLTTGVQISVQFRFDRLMPEMW